MACQKNVCQQLQASDAPALRAKFIRPHPAMLLQKVDVVRTAVRRSISKAASVRYRYSCEVDLALEIERELLNLHVAPHMACTSENGKERIYSPRNISALVLAQSKARLISKTHILSHLRKRASSRPKRIVHGVEVQSCMWIKTGLLPHQALTMRNIVCEWSLSASTSHLGMC